MIPHTNMATVPQQYECVGCQFLIEAATEISGAVLIPLRSAHKRGIQMFLPKIFVQQKRHQRITIFKLSWSVREVNDARLQKEWST